MGAPGGPRASLSHRCSHLPPTPQKSRLGGGPCQVLGLLSRRWRDPPGRGRTSHSHPQTSRSFSTRHPTALVLPDSRGGPAPLPRGQGLVAPTPPRAPRKPPASRALCGCPTSGDGPHGLSSSWCPKRHPAVRPFLPPALALGLALPLHARGREVGPENRARSQRGPWLAGRGHGQACLRLWGLAVSGLGEPLTHNPPRSTTVSGFSRSF